MSTHANMPSLRIGTSGWVYRHWRGVFYPEDLPAREHLDFYASRFSTVEINNSFYRLPPRETFDAWRARTPDRFLFAVKASRYLTHMKKLKDSKDALALFLGNAAGLGKKLGPVLFQFPRTWALHLERLREFLDLLGAHRRLRFAFEFRHESWLTEEVYTLLGAAGAALCLPVSPKTPLDARLTAAWTYIRMHEGRTGTGYTGRELEDWAVRVRSFLESGADVYIYFNNDPGGHAVKDALRLEEMLETVSAAAAVAAPAGAGKSLAGRNDSGRKRA